VIADFDQILPGFRPLFQVARHAFTTAAIKSPKGKEMRAWADREMPAF
jgi:hypothetical protein